MRCQRAALCAARITVAAAVGRSEGTSGGLRRTSTSRILIVEKTDRLYRNIKDSTTIADLGIEVHV